ncbi:protein FAM183A [Poeciliopsis prolifica]|uniref:protein FAM183A n=1 Tax=Poeciliopsis prolifica TaxID=188132 RepID=UPI0024134C0D|nr:protein FAM183A [Poeciliopsis prolifica]
MAGGRQEKDLVHLNAIHVENVKKERRYQKLHTEFSINPFRKLHVIPDKPMCKKPPESLAEDTTYIDAYRRVRMAPSLKYPKPITESQEIGWFASQLPPQDREDQRFNFPRRKTDITQLALFTKKRGD